MEIRIAEKKVMNNFIYLAVLILSTTAQDSPPSSQQKTDPKCDKGTMPCIMPYTVQYSLACTKSCKRYGCEDGFCEVDSNCKELTTLFMCSCYGCASGTKKQFLFYLHDKYR